MPGVALSSLRVTADMDASGFVRGSQQITQSAAAAGDSADRLGQALAKQDSALAQVVPGMASLSKALIDGYSQGSKFYSTLDRIENSLNKGMSADRAEVMIRSLMERTGQVADATDLWNNKLQMTAQIVDKINSKSFAANFQQGINNNLGVNPGSGAGSAQASADAFLAQYGGLEGVAKAKAQSIADAFSSELDARLISGTGKSARDSASVFQTELDKLDKVSSMRAQQAGTYFAQDLDERLIAGSGKSAKDSASVFAAEMDKMDSIAQAKAEQIGKNFQQSLNESMGIGVAPKSAAQSASVFQQFDQQAKAADDLKAKYVPLYAAQRQYNSSLAEVNSLYKSGHIDQDQYIGAVNGAEKVFNSASKEAEALAAGTGGASAAAAFGNTQFMALTAAFRHMFDSIAAGRPIFQTIASELGNLSYGLSGSGGFMGALKAIGGGILSFLSPGIVTIGALAASFGAATIAAIQYGNAQAEVARQLSGIGRASGATTTDIDRIASNDANGLSTSGARGVASALAGTGKMGVDQIGAVVQLGHDFAKTFGVDATNAAKLLASAFDDPVKGADELNKRLGFLSAGQKELISNMMASGRQFDAQQVLLEGMKSGLASATDLTTGWGKAWEAVTVTISNAWTAIGRGLFGGDNSIQAKLDSAKTQLEGLKDLQAMGGAVGSGDVTGAIKDTEAEVDRLTAKLAAAGQEAEDTRLNIQSLLVRPQADTVLPEVKQIEALKNAQLAIGGADEDPILQKKLGLTQSQVSEAKARIDGVVSSFRNAFQKAADAAQISFESITAYSAADKGLIAYKQTLDSLASNSTMSPADKEKLAWMAYANAVQQVTAQLEEAGRVRLETASQTETAAKLDIDLIGKTTQEQQRLRGEQQNLFTLQKEADLHRSTLDTVQLEALNKKTAKLAELKAIESARLAVLNATIAAEQASMGPIQAKIDQAVKQSLGPGANANTPGAEGIAASINTEEVQKLVASALPAQTAIMNAKDAVAALNREMASGNPTLQAYADKMGISLTEAAQRFATAARMVTLNDTDPGRNAVTAAQEQVKALDDRSVATRIQQAQAAERRALAAQGKPDNGNDPMVEARITLAGALAAGGATRRDADEKEKIQALGGLATVTQLVRQKELDLNNVRRDGISLTPTEKAGIIDIAREQAQAAKISEQVTNGIFHMNEAAENSKLHLKNLVADGTIKNMEDLANATNKEAKALETMKNNAAVAGAPLEGLKRLEIESGSLRTQLDTFATDSLNNLTNSLVSISNGTTKAKDAFKNLGLEVITSLEKMIIKMLIIQPIAAALQSTLGGMLGGGGAGAASGGGGIVMMLAHMFGAANGAVMSGGSPHAFAYGGVVSRPTIFPMASGGIGLMGEAGPEAIMPLTRGAGGVLGVRNHGGGGPQYIDNRNYDFRGVDKSIVGSLEARLRNAEKAIQNMPATVATQQNNRPRLTRS